LRARDDVAELGARGVGEGEGVRVGGDRGDGQGHLLGLEDRGALVPSRAEEENRLHVPGDASQSSVCFIPSSSAISGRHPRLWSRPRSSSKASGSTSGGGSRSSISDSGAPARRQESCAISSSVRGSSLRPMSHAPCSPRSTSSTTARASSAAWQKERTHRRYTMTGSPARACLSIVGIDPRRAPGPYGNENRRIV